jgi:hypothetical protein
LSNDSDAVSDATSIKTSDGDKQGGNELFLAVLPLIHISTTAYLGYGMTEQTLTLFPDRRFATEFFDDEVDNYILAFESRAQKYLTGGHVTGYNVNKVQTEPGRWIVRVVQRVG